MKFLGVPAVWIDSSVGSKPDLHPFIDRFPHDRVSRFQSSLHLVGYQGWVATFSQDLFAAFERHQRWDEVRAAGLHQIQRFVVQKGAMFDRIDASPDGALGAFCAMRMCCSLLA